VTIVKIRTTGGKINCNKTTGQKEKMYCVNFTTPLHTRPKNAKIITEKQNRRLIIMLMSASSSQENKKLIIVSMLLKIQWKLQKYEWYADSGATREMYGTEKISSRLKNVTNSWTAE
jgi:hypothetical protein